MQVCREEGSHAKLHRTVWTRRRWHKGRGCTSWSSTLTSGTENEKSLLLWGFFHDDNTWLIHGWSTRDTALRTADVLSEAVSWPHEHCSEKCTCSQQRENILLENNQRDTHRSLDTVQVSFMPQNLAEHRTCLVKSGAVWGGNMRCQQKLLPRGCEFLNTQL